MHGSVGRRSGDAVTETPAAAARRLSGRPGWVNGTDTPRHRHRHRRIRRGDQRHGRVCGETAMVAHIVEITERVHDRACPPLGNRVRRCRYRGHAAGAGGPRILAVDSQIRRRQGAVDDRPGTRSANAGFDRMGFDRRLGPTAAEPSRRKSQRYSPTGGTGGQSARITRSQADERTW